MVKHWGLRLCARRALAFVCSFLVVALAGCGDSGYEKKGGQWHYNGHAITPERGNTFKPLTGPFARDASVGYYRGAPIPGSHGPTFKPVDDQYAVDQSRAYFCDTYRKGQEYYTYKHNRMVVLEAVALDSFRSLKRGYARDATRLYYEGAHVAVKDLETFEVMEDSSYQRDRVTAYYERRPIPGSDGSTFAVLGGGYSKDKTGVYFSHYRPVDAALRDKTIRLAGASPDSFAVKAGGYAVDVRHAYHNGIVLTKDAASFETLASLYAKTASAVYFDGKPIAGADAKTFTVPENRDGDADAYDARRRYRNGEPLAATTAGDAK